MDIDKQIERSKRAIELYGKRSEIANDMKIVYDNRICGVKPAFHDYINTLDSNDFEKITNLTYELLSKKYEAISDQIIELLIPIQ